MRSKSHLISKVFYRTLRIKKIDSHLLIKNNKRALKKRFSQLMEPPCIFNEGINLAISPM